MSFGELTVVVIVALVIFGPKELPKILRKLGQWSGKLRRMAADFRTQSGIDEALRTEGLDLDLREIRKLARGEIEGVVSAARVTTAAAGAAAISSATAAALASHEFGPPVFSDLFVERDRENPREGADSYGALPDTAIVYDGSLPKSALADDPLYVLGDASAKIPERKTAEAEASPAAEPPAQ